MHSETIDLRDTEGLRGTTGRACEVLLKLLDPTLAAIPILRYLMTYLYKYIYIHLSLSIYIYANIKRERGG